MKIEIKDINGYKRFSFVTKSLLKDKEVEVVGIKDSILPMYHVVFYNKTDKEFYGYISEPSEKIEGSQNVVFQKNKKV